MTVRMAMALKTMQ